MRRHVFVAIPSKRGEREEHRCKRCHMSRMLVGVLRCGTFTATRLVHLYRKHGGFSWSTYYPGCAT